MVEYLGLWGLLALTLNMWALLAVLGSGISLTGKAIWALVLLTLPGVGFVAWFLLRPPATA